MKRTGNDLEDDLFEFLETPTSPTEVNQGGSEPDLRKYFRKMILED